MGPKPVRVLGSGVRGPGSGVGGPGSGSGRVRGSGRVQAGGLEVGDQRASRLLVFSFNISLQKSVAFKGKLSFNLQNTERLPAALRRSPLFEMLSHIRPGCI